MFYFYESKVRYTKQTGEDNPAKVTEKYVVQDINFGGAESILLNLLMPYAFGGDIEVVSMKKVAPHDIIACESPEKVFKCKAVLIVVDGDKESRKPVFFYVGADDLESARKKITDYLRSYDAELLSVEETKIIDIYKRPLA